MANIFTNKHHFNIIHECDARVLNQIKRKVTNNWINNPKIKWKTFSLIGIILLFFTSVMHEYQTRSSNKLLKVDLIIHK